MTPPFSSSKRRGFLGPSLELGSVSGIPIRVHWSFALLLAWSAFSNFSFTGSGSATLLGMGFVLVVFGCVLLHELGHSLTAQRFGIQTRSITLSPIGGVAALESSPRNWKEELWITAAGPAVNAAIALLLLPFVILTLTPDVLAVAPFSSFPSFLFLLFCANAMLTLFNLVPAFPMDGGRLFRSFLTPSQGKLRATRIAARTGQVFALLIALGGLFLSPFMLLIGVFVFLAAAAELRNVELEEGLSGTTVSDAMRHSFDAIAASDPVDDAIRRTIHSGQHSLPVMKDGNLLGLVTFASLVEARSRGLGGTPVETLISHVVPSVSPYEDLLPVLRTMQGRNCDVIPVVRENRLIGLLPRRSIQSLLTLRSA